MDCRSEWNGRCDLPHGLHVVIHIVQVDGTHECDDVYAIKNRSSAQFRRSSGTQPIAATRISTKNRETLENKRYHEAEDTLRPRSRNILFTREHLRFGADPFTGSLARASQRTSVRARNNPLYRLIAAKSPQNHSMNRYVLPARVTNEALWETLSRPSAVRVC
jgi:hypothetical protein